MYVYIQNFIYTTIASTTAVGRLVSMRGVKLSIYKKLTIYKRYKNKTNKKYRWFQLHDYTRILSIRISWFMESKAFLTSRKTIQFNCPLSMFLSKLSHIYVCTLILLDVGAVQRSSCSSRWCEVLEDRCRYPEKKWLGRGRSNCKLVLYRCD